MKLTVKELYELQYVDLAKRPAIDFSGIAKSDIQAFLNDESIVIQKRDVVKEKAYTCNFLDEIEKGEGVEGNQYYNPDTDSIVEYIALDRLRFKIDELGKREYGEIFNLGKKTWKVVIEHPVIALGESFENSYIAFDDIDDCYKAQHPRSKQQGFNLRCIETFYKENIENIMKIMIIMEKQYEKEQEETQRAQQAKAKLQRAKAKLQREASKELSQVGGLL